MMSKHQQRCRRQRRGRCFWRFCNGCLLWRRCSCMSRRTELFDFYQQKWNASCVAPIAGSVDDWEWHLVVPFSWIKWVLRSRGLRVSTEWGMLGLVCAATSTSWRILCTDSNLLVLASLKMGRLPPYPLSPRRLVKVKYLSIDIKYNVN